jgi:hypothetical protein
MLPPSSAAPGAARRQRALQARSRAAAPKHSGCLFDDGGSVPSVNANAVSLLICGWTSPQ